MTAKKRTYRKGMSLFNNTTKEKIVFGKWNDDGTAACLTPDHHFLNLTREEIDTQYTSYIEVEKQAKERRRGQGW